MPAFYLEYWLVVTGIFTVGFTCGSYCYWIDSDRIWFCLDKIYRLALLLLPLSILQLQSLMSVSWVCWETMPAFSKLNFLLVITRACMPWVSPPFLKRKKGQPKLIDCPWLRFMADSSTYNKTLPNRSPPFCIFNIVWYWIDLSCPMIGLVYLVYF